MNSQWTRAMLKQNAWNNLRNYYWTAFGVCLLASILGADSGGGGGASSGGSVSESDMETLEQGFSDIDPALLMGIIIGFIVVFVVAFAIAFAFYAFLGGPVEAGRCKFFLKARSGDVNFGSMFDNFGSGKYLSTVKVMFFRMLYTTLWSFLFIIPGIVKGLEYFLIPYLMAENPNLSKERAFEISRRTMEGEKWNLFVLQLSFIGWYLLGVLACCVGTVFVVPYEVATYTEFYLCMREKMLAMGITTESELTGGYTDLNGYSDPGRISLEKNPYNG